MCVSEQSCLEDTKLVIVWVSTVVESTEIRKVHGGMGAAGEQWPEISATSAPKPEKSAGSLIHRQRIVERAQEWTGYTAFRVGYRSINLI